MKWIPEPRRSWIALVSSCVYIATAAARPLIVLFCSASFPITLTKTRACLRSGVTRTRDGDQGCNARSFNSAGNHNAQLVENLLGDAFVPMSRDRHRCLTVAGISNEFDLLHH